MYGEMAMKGRLAKSTELHLHQSILSPYLVVAWHETHKYMSEKNCCILMLVQMSVGPDIKAMNDESSIADN